MLEKDWDRYVNKPVSLPVINSPLTQSSRNDSHSWQAITQQPLTVNLRIWFQINVLVYIVRHKFMHLLNFRSNVRPGLAQLVERLTHRYSESTSSNPSNSLLIGQHMRWISGNVHYVCLRNANKAAHSGFWNPEETSLEIQNRGTSGPIKNFDLKTTLDLDPQCFQTVTEGWTAKTKQLSISNYTILQS